MHIIKTMADIRRLKLAGSITQALAEQFARKMHHLQEELAPELDLENFNLEMHGVFGVVETTDQDLSAIGLPPSFALLMPEWVSRLELAGEVYYVLYFMPDNDMVDQIYVPEPNMPDNLRLWLAEQSIEPESGEEKPDDAVHPF